jgi:hypothetical protein
VLSLARVRDGVLVPRVHDRLPSSERPLARRGQNFLSLLQSGLLYRDGPCGWCINLERMTGQKAMPCRGQHRTLSPVTSCNSRINLNDSHVRATEQFEDEIHPRLRFAHRGLVGLANNGKKNSNDSQFFITLGACALVNT